MSTPAELRCRCGQVRGIVADASPDAVNRVVCFCEDCQAFAHQLDRADLLDAKGGSDIVQVAPASLTFVQGQHHISGLRLTPKGLFRWYASCCKTPVGNTVSPAIPFVGIVVQAFDGGRQRADAVFGKPIGAIFAKHSIGDSPVGSKGISLSLMARAIRMVLGWRLRGRTWPHPVLCPRNGRADLSRDCAVAATARGIASAMRAAIRRRRNVVRDESRFVRSAAAKCSESAPHRSAQSRPRQAGDSNTPAIRCRHAGSAS